MNYFAHGVRHLDRPWFVAGTAVPDWLSVVDRKVRVRTRLAAPFADGGGTPIAELAAGIMQHLADDDWFHRSPEFATVSGVLTRQFRAALPDDDSPRPSFLGHIVTELILDGVLIARDPARLERYYAVFGEVDPVRIEHDVGRIAGKPATGLAWFIGAFVRERFLADYGDPRRLLGRLNQVLRRVTLSPLPDHVEAVLEQAWTLVEGRTPHLLGGFPPGA